MGALEILGSTQVATVEVEDKGVALLGMALLGVALLGMTLLEVALPWEPPSAWSFPSLQARWIWEQSRPGGATGLSPLELWGDINPVSPEAG